MSGKVTKRTFARDAGSLILNADDWGRDVLTTGRILDCVRHRSISSVSAMVFMEDSERAAAIAMTENIDAGLHLNLTTPFSAPGTPRPLAEHQHLLCNHLRRHRLSQLVFHPGLARSFKYVVAAQCDEFRRMYGSLPGRIDGHHHMHLCSNVLLGGLLPPGTVVRRNFSFQPGEKSFVNCLYRRVVDRFLARRHAMTDFFFSLPPLEPPGRILRIVSLSRRFAVEVETHPVNPAEHRFLTSGEIFRWVGDLVIAPRYTIRRHVPVAN